MSGREWDSPPLYPRRQRSRPHRREPQAPSREGRQQVVVGEGGVGAAEDFASLLAGLGAHAQDGWEEEAAREGRGFGGWFGLQMLLLLLLLGAALVVEALGSGSLVTPCEGVKVGDVVLDLGRGEEA